MFRNPTTDLIVVLVIVLLIFGPKRLPGLGKQLGQGLREFKDSVTGGDSDARRGRERPRSPAPPLRPVAGTGEPSVTAEPAPASAPSAQRSAERSA